ncbi:MAG TPA: serine hydrolase [Thermoanaerobaculia bacterium]|jgi:CubicO group peptidase (beta-lactamase class C family)|nr:serine hydrolase [Thermoanaerobaculia bacterium]
MPPSFLLGVLALGLLSRCATAPNAALDPATSTEIRRIIEQQMRSQHIPGAVLAIVRDDRVVFMQPIGLRDIEHNLPVTPDTLFPIGSCTKAFTSMEIARSVDRGLLSLDDHPRKFLPYLKLADPEADARVTIRDMLSHRTGLKAYADLAAEPGVLTREEYIRAATSAKPAVKFRTKFQYSNAMYAAAGEIAGRANHSSWEEVVASDIFHPLGMTSSVAVITDMLTSPDHATGYVFDKTYRAVPAPKSLTALAPGGAIASSARDMTQWLRMLTGGGRIDGRQFISPAMFRELTTPLIAVNETTSYALGWAVYDWNGLRVVEHNGGSDGISALVSFIPEKHVGFIFLANTSSNAMTKVGTGAARLLYPLLLGQKVPPTSAVPLSPKPVIAPIGVDAPSADALLARLIDAAGGEAALRAHTSVALHAHKSYDNQGVFADLTIEAKSPDLHNEVEVWTAANREIGRLRVYFDGSRGGQETTFGQDSINEDAANARDHRQYAFPQPLALKNLYKTITVRAGDDDTWIIETGDATQLRVSRKTALVTGREKEGERISFDDYRNVDGELVPFRSTIEDALGTSTIVIDSVRFNVPFDDGVFSPGR